MVQWPLCPILPVSYLKNIWCCIQKSWPYCKKMAHAHPPIRKRKHDLLEEFMGMCENTIHLQHSCEHFKGEYSMVDLGMLHTHHLVHKRNGVKNVGTRQLANHALAATVSLLLKNHKLNDNIWLITTTTTSEKETHCLLQHRRHNQHHRHIHHRYHHQQHHNNHNRVRQANKQTYTQANNTAKQERKHSIGDEFAFFHQHRLTIKWLTHRLPCEDMFLRAMRCNAFARDISPRQHEQNTTAKKQSRGGTVNVPGHKHIQFCPCWHRLSAILKWKRSLAFFSSAWPTRATLRQSEFCSCKRVRHQSVLPQQRGGCPLKHLRHTLA